jgi:hypothetical protein
MEKDWRKNERVSFIIPFFPSKSKEIILKLEKNKREEGPIYFCERDGTCFQGRRREISDAISKLWKW